MLSLFVSSLFTTKDALNHNHSVFTGSLLGGFDAAGHIAEETKNARCDIKLELLQAPR